MIFLYYCSKITSIDISEVVINQRISRNNVQNENRPDLKFLVMDATKLEIPDACFDVVVDKSTLDALLTARTDLAVAMLREVHFIALR